MTGRPPPIRVYPSTKPLCADPTCRMQLRPPAVLRMPYAIMRCHCGVHSFILTAQGVALVVGLTDGQAERFSDDNIRPAAIFNELGLLEYGQRKAS